VHARLEPESPRLNFSLFNNVFASPYKTDEAHFAINSWHHLAGPDGINAPLRNALHNALGVYIPQAAWHLEPVRHSLLSAAFLTLVLGAEELGMSLELQSSMSKKSVVHMHLAIQSIMKESQASLSSVLAATMLGVVCSWTGRWAEGLQNFGHALRINQALQARGEFINEEALTTLESIIEATRLLPAPMAIRTKSARLRYGCCISTSASAWIETLIPVLGTKKGCEALILALRTTKARLKSILGQWRILAPKDNSVKQIPLEGTPFAPALRMIRVWLNGDPIDCNNFDRRLFTARLTLGLKTTLMYGGSGDAKRLREAAIACHSAIELPDFDE
jgi:hypothetical protein